MTFQEGFVQVIAWIQYEQRIAHRALKQEVALDDEYLADLKSEKGKGYQLAVDQEGKIELWIAKREMIPAPIPPPQPAQRSLTPKDQPAHVKFPPSASRAPDAERRQLTLFFDNRSVAAKPASQPAPENLREMIRAHQVTCAEEVIEPFDGYSAHYLGERLLIFFGLSIG